MTAEARAWGQLQRQGWGSGVRARASAEPGPVGGRQGSGRALTGRARSLAPGSGAVRGVGARVRPRSRLHGGRSPAAYPAATSFRQRCVSQGITGSRELLAGAGLLPLPFGPEAAPRHGRHGDASRTWWRCAGSPGSAPEQGARTDSPAAGLPVLVAPPHRVLVGPADRGGPALARGPPAVPNADTDGRPRAPPGSERATDSLLERGCSRAVYLQGG